MTRFVIGPEVALHLALERPAVSDDHQLVAPTLLRSQVLSLLYQSVRRGDVTRADANRQLDYIRAFASGSSATASCNAQRGASPRNLAGMTPLTPNTWPWPGFRQTPFLQRFQARRFSKSARGDFVSRNGRTSTWFPTGDHSWTPPKDT